MLSTSRSSLGLKLILLVDTGCIFIRRLAKLVSVCFSTFEKNICFLVLRLPFSWRKKVCVCSILTIIHFTATWLCFMFYISAFHCVTIQNQAERESTRVPTGERERERERERENPPGLRIASSVQSGKCTPPVTRTAAMPHRHSLVPS
jgi:hypothetical protein